MKEKPKKEISQNINSSTFYKKKSYIFLYSLRAKTMAHFIGFFLFFEKAKTLAHFIKNIFF